MDKLWSQGLIFVHKVSRERDTPIRSLSDDGRFRATKAKLYGRDRKLMAHKAKNIYSLPFTGNIC